MTVLAPILGVDLVAQLSIARDRLDRGVLLLNRALDLREQLAWGVLDMDVARDMVAEFKRAVGDHKRVAR
jgi:hypothetical protein